MRLSYFLFIVGAMLVSASAATDDKVLQVSLRGAAFGDSNRFLRSTKADNMDNPEDERALDMKKAFTNWKEARKDFARGDLAKMLNGKGFKFERFEVWNKYPEEKVLKEMRPIMKIAERVKKCDKKVKVNPYLLIPLEYMNFRSAGKKLKIE